MWWMLSPGPRLNCAFSDLKRVVLCLIDLNFTDSLPELVFANQRPALGWCDQSEACITDTSAQWQAWGARHDGIFCADLYFAYPSVIEWNWKVAKILAKRRVESHCGLCCRIRYQPWSRTDSQAAESDILKEWELLYGPSSNLNSTSLHTTQLKITSIFLLIFLISFNVQGIQPRPRQGETWKVKPSQAFEFPFCACRHVQWLGMSMGGSLSQDTIFLIRLKKYLWWERSNFLKRKEVVKLSNKASILKQF